MICAPLRSTVVVLSFPVMVLSFCRCSLVRSRGFPVSHRGSLFCSGYLVTSCGSVVVLSLEVGVFPCLTWVLCSVVVLLLPVVVMSFCRCSLVRSRGFPVPHQGSLFCSGSLVTSCRSVVLSLFSHSQSGFSRFVTNRISIGDNMVECYCVNNLFWVLYCYCIDSILRHEKSSCYLNHCFVCFLSNVIYWAPN